MYPDVKALRYYMQNGHIVDVLYFFFPWQVQLGITMRMRMIVLTSVQISK